MTEEIDKGNVGGGESAEEARRSAKLMPSGSIPPADSLVVIEKIVQTGNRYLPKGILGKTGKVLGKVRRHGKEWIVVGFKVEKKSFSHFCLGNPSYYFLEEEIKYVSV